MQRRILELLVVRQNHDVRLGRDLNLRQGFVRPGDDQLVDVREPLARGEEFARIDHRRSVAEFLGHCHERNRDVDRTDHDKVSGRQVGFQEDLDGAPVGQGIGSDPGFAALEEGLRISAHRSIEFGRAERADGATVLVDQKLCAEWLTADDRCGDDCLLLSECMPESFEDLTSHGFLTNGSTKTSIVPPQLRPTSQACSSEMP
ncbi:hypothetical protein HRbin27_01221 [bacterium HR27]|nr:hypothetical protein HRbin27_01221 [bacterium HR27]